MDEFDPVVADLNRYLSEGDAYAYRRNTRVYDEEASCDQYDVGRCVLLYSARLPQSQTKNES